MKIYGPDGESLTIDEVAELPGDTTENNLEPCPHCGGPASIHATTSCFHDRKPGWRVECEGDCHAMTCWWHSEEEARAWWNTRRGPKRVTVEGLPDPSRESLARETS